jgi:hypothetical protein
MSIDLPRIDLPRICRGKDHVTSKSVIIDPHGKPRQIPGAGSERRVCLKKPRQKAASSDPARVARAQDWE